MSKDLLAILTFIRGQFVGYADATYQRAACTILSMTERVDGGLQLVRNKWECSKMVRNIKTQYLLTRDEWISSAAQVDVERLWPEYDKEPYMRSAYSVSMSLANAWLWKTGTVITDHLCWRKTITQEAFDYLVDVKRVKLLREVKEVTDLFYYMKGIGFLLKADGWQDIGHQLRSQQLALAYLGEDTQELDQPHEGLIDCGQDRVFVSTATQIEIDWFDRLAMDTVSRMGRCQAQEGHPFSRIRGDAEDEESTAYDGYAGLNAAHDIHQATLLEQDECNRAGVKGHVADIIAMDKRFNRACFLQQDVCFNDLFNHKRKSKALAIFALMGIQLPWLDKSSGKGNLKYRTLHNRFVHDPMTLKLCAQRAVRDPEYPLAQKHESLENGPVQRNIYSEWLTNYYQRTNKIVFAVSRKIDSRAGKHIWVVVWDPSWSEPQLRMVFQLKDWTFAVKSDVIALNSKGNPVIRHNGETIPATHLGLSVQGDLKHQILGLMGIIGVPCIDDETGKDRWAYRRQVFQTQTTHLKHGDPVVKADELPI